MTSVDLDVQGTLRLLVDDWNADGGSVDVSVRQHALIGMCVFGLTAQTHHLADAALRLDEHRLHLAAVPLVRQALECAITAIWIERSGYPAVLTLLREQTRQAKNTLEQFVKAGMPRNDEAINAVTTDLADSMATTTQSEQKINHRCAELEIGATLYAMYRAASEVSHAGTAIVDRYLDGAEVTDVSPLGVGLCLQPGDEANDTWMRALLLSVVLATSAWSRIDRNHTARTRMKDLCRSLDIAYTQTLSAAGLKAQRIRRDEFKAWAAKQPEGEQADPMRGASPVSPDI